MSLQRMSKEFSKNVFMFVKQIIEKTKVHFKILELFVQCCRTAPVELGLARKFRTG